MNDDKHRRKHRDDHRNTRDKHHGIGSHKRQRSRSPVSQSSHGKSIQDERDHRRFPRLPEQSQLKSSNFSVASDGVRSHVKGTYSKGTFSGSTTATDSCNNEGIIVNKKELEGTISSGEKESFEQAIVAAQELASKQPSYLSAKPMSQQQKIAQEKRKLLWSGKKQKAASRNQWENVSLGKDGEDDKFRRLMGIGGNKAVHSQPSEDRSEGSAKGSEKALTALEQQYEASRYLTHIARGAGLGYGSQALTTELPSQKDSSDKLHETL